MLTFIAVCLGLITVEIGIIVAALIAAALQVNRTAKAVEVLAYRVEAEVEGFGSTMRSGWMRALQATASLATGFWRRSKDD